MGNPKDYNDGTNVECGYRIFVGLKTGASGEVMAFPHCLITSHSVSLNADGTSEETMEFMTQQQMIAGADGDTLPTTVTAVGAY